MMYKLTVIFTICINAGYVEKTQGNIEMVFAGNILDFSRDNIQLGLSEIQYHLRVQAKFSALTDSFYRW